jgi:hypothetical protein
MRSVEEQLAGKFPGRTNLYRLGGVGNFCRFRDMAASRNRTETVTVTEFGVFELFASSRVARQELLRPPRSAVGTQRRCQSQLLGRPLNPGVISIRAAAPD